MKKIYLFIASMTFCAIAFAQTNYGVNSGTSGAICAYFGYNSGRYNTNDNNSFFGEYSGQDLVGGYQNSFFGAWAGGASNETSSSINSYNSFFGAFSGLYNNGVANCFFGAGSGVQNTSGGGNCFF